MWFHGIFLFEISLVNIAVSKNSRKIGIVFEVFYLRHENIKPPIVRRGHGGEIGHETHQVSLQAGGHVHKLVPRFVNIHFPRITVANLENGLCKFCDFATKVESKIWTPNTLK